MSKLFTVTKEIQFCYGHRVPFHNSKCKNVHGHQAKVECTVEGPLIEGQQSDTGMVIDFSEIKRAMVDKIELRFDHRLLLWDKDPIIAKLGDCDDYTPRCQFGQWVKYPMFGEIYELPCIPTAENLAMLCYEMLSVCLNKGQVRVVAVKFWETPTSVAEYLGKEDDYV